MKYIDRIRALREDRDLTQTDVANLLNIGQKTYSDYELGKTRIPLDSMLVPAKYYDVSMDYLSGASNIKTPYPRK
ncbi:MAG TPA: XRE family transcriptional regulator [Ruminococcaceae bacterium]|nr:XRE family transcriptional regulator [Oscillospiraceae bacterium]